MYGTDLLTTFKELNYFNVLSAKSCTPNVILTRQNLGANIPQDVLDLTLAIHNDLASAFSESNVTVCGNPGRTISLQSLETILRCLKFSDPLDDEAIRTSWKVLLQQHLYLPLWTQSDREIVRQILKNHDVAIDESNDNIFQRTMGHIEDAIRSGRRLIVLVGMAGVGKRSMILQTCKNLDFKMHGQLIDPTNVDVVEHSDEVGNETDTKVAYIINNLLFASMNKSQDTDKYVHEIKSRLLPVQRAITFLSLSVVHYQPLLLKRLLTQLRQEGGAILGVPEWTPQDLNACFEKDPDSDTDSADLGTNNAYLRSPVCLHIAVCLQSPVCIRTAVCLLSAVYLQSINFHEF